MLNSYVFVVYCEDGYVGIDSAAEFLNKGSDHNEASLQISMGDEGGPRDV